VIKKCIETLEENLLAMVKELTPETTGNWRPYRDLIQRQMIQAMRIVVLLFSGVFLWVTLGDAVPASGGLGKNELRPGRARV
jgi:hypothetical protein